MEKIASFTVDHIKLQPGIYVSRKDTVGQEVITTFDLRMTSPNEEPVMNTAEMHTIEHLGATFLRNHPVYKDKTIYFGPMGCRTGFYLLLAGDYESKDIVPLIREMFEFIRDYKDEVPGASARDCGNYLDMNLPMANYLAKKYLTEVLDHISDERLIYPEKHGGKEMLGIIGAMEIEVNRIKEQMEDVSVTDKAGMSFFEGKWNGNDVVVVRSGIGKVNAAVCAQILADTFHADAIINTGIAGSLKNEINIGDIVLSTDAIQHDMDAQGFGYAPGVIPQMEVSDFQADEKLIELAKKCCAEVCPDIQVFTGRVVSGDQFISDKKKKEWLSSQFEGLCAEMEGAAIAQAAYLNHVPFLIIRAISDKADDSATMDYPEFEAMAAENSVKLLADIVRQGI